MALDATPLADTESAPLEVPSRGRSLARAAGLCLLLLALAGSLSRAGCAPGPWWHGESTLFGRRRYVPSLRVPDSQLRRIDFERVFAGLLPRYLLALQRVHQRDARALADEAYVPLRRALAPDANLLALLAELDRLVRHDARLHAPRIHWLTWAFDDYLRARGVPYRLELRVRGAVGRSTLFFRSYAVVREHEVRVGSGAYTARWLRRVDRTNLREAEVGHTSDDAEGALVLVDRVADLALDAVWPLLDPSTDARAAPLARAHGPFVREEARRVLSAESLAVLARTASARVSLVGAARDIDGRASCGSRTRVGRPPLRGFTLEAVARARDFAASTVRDECPELLPEEVEDIERASAVLRAEPALGTAVLELLRWVGRAVAAHEARHAADDRLYDGLARPLRCARCGGASTVVRAELSAFVASFASEGLGRVAHYQACLLAEGDDGPHAEAMRLLARLPNGAFCAAPPAELYARARGWERALFAREEPVRVSAVRGGEELLPP